MNWKASPEQFRRQPNASTKGKINLHLLRCAVKLAFGNPEQGLQDATTALKLATENEIYHMQSKAQLYRGLCFKEMKAWRKARDCFVLAANVRGWAERVPSLGRECELKIGGTKS
jgi:hypothetical protein